MFVRIFPKNEAPSDFEVKGDCAFLTEKIQQTIKDIIQSKTGIPPEEQNALFSPSSNGMRNIKQIYLPTGMALTPEYVNSELESKYSDAYRNSVIEVGTVGNWRDADLQIRSNGMHVVTDAIEDAGEFLGALYHDLNKSRPVDASKLHRFLDLCDAIEKDGQLRDFFETTDASTSPVTAKELACYDYIHRHVVGALLRFKNKTRKGSASHSGLFGTMMMYSPFLLDDHESLGRMELLADLDTDLRLFLRPSGREEIYKYTPRSDHCVMDKLSGLPTLICEVDSHNGGKDERRMLMQGAVACRHWRFGLPDPLKEKNKLLALFVKDDFSVHLSLFHTDSDNEVTIYKGVFSMKQRIDALRLARILFNYRDGLTDITGQFDQKRANMVQSLFSETNNLPSLSSVKRNSTKNTPKGSQKKAQKSGQGSKGKSNLPPVPEEVSVEILLRSLQVKSLFEIDDTFLQVTQNKHVAAVKMFAPPFSILGFIKITNKQELDAFDAIRKSGCGLLSDRIILPTKVARVSGNSVVFLPYGGEPLCDVLGDGGGPSGKEAEISLDLLRIVVRLHEIGIAHLDIKPANILWDTSTQSIRLIDFDSSVIVDPEGDQKIKGLFGTSGYIAPEVERHLEYDPFLADAFSCGKFISEMIVNEKMSQEARTVLELSRLLRNDDVEKRWSVNKVMAVWSDQLKERKGEHRWSKNNHFSKDSDGYCLSDGLKSMSIVCVH